MLNVIGPQPSPHPRPAPAPPGPASGRRPAGAATAEWPRHVPSAVHSPLSYHRRWVIWYSKEPDSDPRILTPKSNEIPARAGPADRFRIRIWCHGPFWDHNLMSSGPFRTDSFIFHCVIKRYHRGAIPAVVTRSRYHHVIKGISSVSAMVGFHLTASRQQRCSLSLCYQTLSATTAFL